jgi:hypothetical protein
MTVASSLKNVNKQLNNSMATKTDYKKLSDAYGTIFETVSQALPNNTSPGQQISNYTTQYQQANPTKAVQPQPTTAQSNPQQQINTLMQRLGNLEKQVADLIARQQQPTL